MQALQNQTLAAPEDNTITLKVWSTEDRQSSFHDDRATLSSLSSISPVKLTDYT